MRIEAILANADNATTRTGEALEIALIKIRYPWVWKQIWKQLVNEFKQRLRHNFQKLFVADGLSDVSVLIARVKNDVMRLMQAD